MKGKLMGLLLGAALMIAPCAVRAEIVPAQLPDAHIARSVMIDGIEVTVDADVYGANVDKVQAYQVKKQDLGKTPEAKVDLSAWIGNEEIVRRTEPEENDIRFETASGAQVQLADYMHSFRGAGCDRLDGARLGVMMTYAWADNTSLYPETPQIAQLPGMSVSEAVQKLAPIMEQLNVTLVDEPFDGIRLGLDELNEATRMHLEEGVAPNQTLTEGWTAEDEHYCLRLPMLYHGLRIMPWQENTKKLDFDNTPDAYAYAWITRQGVEKLVMDFVPGEEKAVGDAFVPISAEEALDACERELKKQEKNWGIGESAEILNPHISRMWLGYVMMPDHVDKSRLSTNVFRATPAWLMSIYYDNSEQKPMGNASWQKNVAIDARTGESLLSW